MVPSNSIRLFKNGGDFSSSLNKTFLECKKLRVSFLLHGKEEVVHVQPFYIDPRLLLFYESQYLSTMVLCCPNRGKGSRAIIYDVSMGLLKIINDRLEMQKSLSSAPRFRILIPPCFMHTTFSWYIVKFTLYRQSNPNEFKRQSNDKLFLKQIVFVPNGSIYIYSGGPIVP